MNLILQAIKSIISKLENRINNLRSDWDQNDPNSSGYILNRTHYDEQVLGNFELLPEITVYTFSNHRSEYLGYTDIPLKAGETYIVMINGASYVCVAKEYGYDILLGDETFLSSQEVSYDIYPFAIKAIYGHDIYLHHKDSGNKTVKIINTDPTIKHLRSHKLDKRYLPTDIARLPDSKMNRRNPIGNGIFAMNVYEYNQDSLGENSFVAGKGCIGDAKDVHVIGTHNQSPCTLRIAEKINSVFWWSKDQSIYYGEDVKINSVTRNIEIVNPKVGSISDVLGKQGVYITKSLDEPVFYKTIDGGYTPNENGTSYQLNLFRVYISGTSPLEKGDYVFMVGNGTSELSRSNAHTIDWQGNAWFAGDIYTGSTSGTHNDEGSKKLATEEYVVEQPKPYVYLTDSVNGKTYKLEMQDGTLISQEVAQNE